MSVNSEIRTRLRSATAATHERLHHHAGLGAVASGTINREQYRNLLVRLWGFHTAFEAIVEQSVRLHAIRLDIGERKRSVLIEQDLRACGMDPAALAGLPLCDTIEPPRNEAELFGALYVVEGSTLGGVQLARALRALFDADTSDGRRFFLGYGDQNGFMWRSFLTALDACAEQASHDDILEGATRTFLGFETWMNGWNGTSTTKPAYALIG